MKRSAADAAAAALAKGSTQRSSIHWRTDAATEIKQAPFFHASPSVSSRIVAWQ